MCDAREFFMNIARDIATNWRRVKSDARILRMHGVSDRTQTTHCRALVEAAIQHWQRDDVPVDAPRERQLRLDETNPSHLADPKKLKGKHF